MRRRESVAKAKIAAAKARCRAEERGICPQCHLTLYERHPDCEAAVKIKEVTTSIIALLRESRVYLRDARRLFKKLGSTYIAKKVMQVGHAFYKSTVKEYKKGALADVSAGIVRLFTDGLARLATLLRKTTRFQGNVCLVP